jgi:hypothetical protein
MDQWTGAPEKVSAASDRISSYLNSGYSFYSDNPSILTNLGRLEEFRALLDPSAADSPAENLRSALRAYTLASRVRPANSVSWAVIALIKSQLGEFDSEFDSALTQSVKMGPWEPISQILIVRTGLRYWSHLSGQIRALVRQTATRGMLSRSLGQKKKMARILEEEDFFPLVCPYLPNSDEFSRYCKDT